MSISFAKALFRNSQIYTHLRKLFAGEQTNTKNFVNNALKKYSCKSVIDICSGTGDFAEVDGDISYTGIDNNSHYIEYSKKRYICNDNKKFKIGNVLSIKDNNSYDAALIISTMHHFSDSEFKKICQYILKNIKKVVIIADIIPNPPSVIGRLLVKLDRGDHIREPNEKIALLINDFNIVSKKLIKTGFAYQYCIIAIPKK